MNHEHEPHRLVTAETLRTARTELGLTLEQVAQHLGVTKSTVATWERHGVPYSERNAEIWRVRKT